MIGFRQVRECTVELSSRATRIAHSEESESTNAEAFYNLVANSTFTSELALSGTRQNHGFGQHQTASFSGAGYLAISDSARSLARISGNASR